MRPIRSFALFLAGFAIAGVLFTGLDRAQSDEHQERAAEEAAERAYAQLVGRVKRATLSDGAKPEFQLVFVATEAGSYLESFGHLDPEDAAILGRKLHALGDMVGAPAEIEEIVEALEELEEEIEHHMDEDDEDHDHDDHDDDDDEDDEFADASDDE